MAQGLIQKLQGSFTDDTLPRYYPNDQYLNKGSLILVDFSNPLTGISAPPVSSQYVKNLAWDIAKTMIPSGTEATLSARITSTLTLGSGSLIELTPKKGLHVIVSKVNDIASGNDYFLNFGDSSGVGNTPLIRDYILDNPTHEFYFSSWYEKTRIADTTTSADFIFAENTNSFKFFFGAGSTEPIPSRTDNHIGFLNSPTAYNTAAKYFRAVACKGYVGTINANRLLIPFYWKFTSGGPFGGFEVNKSSSNCLYRVYVEDLTVSGRTFAQARDADKAAFDIAFAPGGKYYGDTLTSPSTLP